MTEPDPTPTYQDYPGGDTPQDVPTDDDDSAEDIVGRKPGDPDYRTSS